MKSNCPRAAMDSHPLLLDVARPKLRLASAQLSATTSTSASPRPSRNSRSVVRRAHPRVPPRSSAQTRQSVESRAVGNTPINTQRERGTWWTCWNTPLTGAPLQVSLRVCLHKHADVGVHCCAFAPPRLHAPVNACCCVCARVVLLVCTSTAGCARADARASTRSRQGSGRACPHGHPAGDGPGHPRQRFR